MSTKSQIVLKLSGAFLSRCFDRHRLNPLVGQDVEGGEKHLNGAHERPGAL